MKRAIYLILLSILTIGCIIFGTIYHTGKAMRHVERWWNEEVEGDDTSSSTEDAVVGTVPEFRHWQPLASAKKRNGEIQCNFVSTGNLKTS